MGILESSYSVSRSGINGSMRSYILTNLVEDSEYAITIEAVNGAGRAASSTMLIIRTSGAGRLIFYM